MKIKKIVGIVLSSIFAASLIAGIFVINSAANKYDLVLTPFLGTSRRNMKSPNYDGVDPFYYKTNNTMEELNEKCKNFSSQVADEGIVLLEKGNIPYKQDNKFSLFSKSSVDFVFGGTGSGVASSDLTLKSALESSGYSINEKLWNFYENGKGKNYKRGEGSINYGDADNFAINEVPLSLIKADNEIINSFNEYKTGIFVLSRTGGEGNDLARGMFPYVDTSLDMNKGLHPDAKKDKYKSYLQPDSIELEIMQYINDNFDDFILIVNCNNAMELSFKDQFNKLSTIIQVPATGEYGINSIGKILKGDIASSGRLTDTIVKDSFMIPSSQNIGDFEYLINGQKIKSLFGEDNYDGLYYMNYDESIYVGYRYFETRYEDLIKSQGNASSNNFKYEDNVIYPFGYGDSIASFSYSDMTLEENDDEFNASLKVKNISEIPAKEVVQFYLSSPYGDFEKTHGVEKSSIELLEFTKTKTLNPNEEETITISFNKEKLKTYLAEGDGQYYLSEGDYYFTFAKDAHAAINNVLKFQGYSDLIASPSEKNAGDTSLVKTLHFNADFEGYKLDSFTGKEIKNQFDFVNLNTYENSHVYLSRKDWQNTYPKIQGELSNIVSIHSERTTISPNGDEGSHEYIKELQTDSLIYKDFINLGTHAPEIDIPDDIKWGQDSNLDFIDLRGLSFDDPRYDEIADKITLTDAINLFSKGGYQTSSAKSINKPTSVDYDGPAGINTVSGHSSIGFSYPCSLIIGQTWNKKLMHEMGELIGEESLHVDVNGWYAPTANIHRSPFGGRNFEYFSEDPLICGYGAKEELNGAAQYGLFGYLKHFALNDQETHREKENGVCIFANEQTIREIYLKAFEIAVKDNYVDGYYYEMQRDENKEIISENNQIKFEKIEAKLPACSAVMSSFSRLGGCWAGACYPLLNNVLVEEWGFHGVILTDYYHNWFMSKEQSLLGGGNCILDPQGNSFNIDANDKKSQYMLKKAVKNIIYGTVNTNTANGYIHGTTEIPMWKNYMTLLIVIDVTFSIGALLLILNIVRLATNFKFRKNKYDPK